MEEKLTNYLKIYNEKPTFLKEKDKTTIKLKHANIIYYPTDTIDKIKNKIHCLFHNISKECLLCYEHNLGVTERSIHCSGCNKQICEKCYIKTIKMNKGQSICSFCRYTKGVILDEHDLSRFIFMYEDDRQRIRKSIIKNNIYKLITHN